jgi:hypothetical protein
MGEIGHFSLIATEKKTFTKTLKRSGRSGKKAKYDSSTDEHGISRKKAGLVVDLWPFSVKFRVHPWLNLS